MLTTASEVKNRVEALLENRIPRALTPPQRSAPELMPTGIAAVDAMTGGIPLGGLIEICGPASCGRTSVLLAAIAECMRRDEICALVDASDAFDPQSAANAGVDLGRLLWVRCKKSGDRVIGSSGEVKPKNPKGQKRLGFKNGFFTSPDRPITRSPDSITRSPDSTTPQIEQALKITDLLLQAGGFGLIILDLADVPISAARRIALTTWFRFRRAVENRSTALIVVEQHPHAKSCASLVMDFSAQQASWSDTADQNETPVGTHGIPMAQDGVAFRVTSEGVVIPFDTPTTSFQSPQRWTTSHARLLKTVHVRLQVTRSRVNQAQKFPAQPEVVIPRSHYRTQ